MLMGFVSYSSLVSEEKLKETISEIRSTSHAKTLFEMNQEEVDIVSRETQ